MRVRIDQSADAIYLNLTDRPIEGSEEVADGACGQVETLGELGGGHAGLVAAPQGEAGREVGGHVSVNLPDKGDPPRILSLAAARRNLASLCAAKLARAVAGTPRWSISGCAQ